MPRAAVREFEEILPFDHDKLEPMSVKSLILVTVDCLRADHVGFLGYSRPTTPFIDSLANESFVVPNAIVGGVPTYYSFPALLSSRGPLALGRDVVGLAPGETSLPAQMKKAGYDTAAFVAANPYISSRFGYDQAFDCFRDFLNQQLLSTDDTPDKRQANSFRTNLNVTIARLSQRWRPAEAIYNELYFHYCWHVAPAVASLDSVRPYPHAETVIRAAGEWLTSVSEKPFFLWLHFMDPHAPYYPPDEALRGISGKALIPAQARYLNAYWNRSDLTSKRLAPRRQAMIELYDAGIRWVDMQLARLVDKLKDLRVWDQCALVFTADHGEEFLEHGGRFHPPVTMREELIRVPLLVRIPGVVGHPVSQEPFSHLDLAPTVMEALNLPIPKQFQGSSRWPEWQNRDDKECLVVVESTECTNPNRTAARLAQRVLCIRGQRYKLVLRSSSNTVELFDLQEDPNEKKPLPADAEKPTRRRLLEYAREYVERSRARAQSEDRVRARLRELRWDMQEATCPVSNT